MSEFKLRQRSSSEERCAWCHSSLDEAFTAVCNSCGSKLHVDCLSRGCPTIGCSSSETATEVAPAQLVEKETPVEQTAPEQQSSTDAKLVFRLIFLVIPPLLIIVGTLVHAAQYEGYISFDKDIAWAIAFAGLLSFLPVAIYFYLTRPKIVEKEFKHYGQD